MKDDCLFCKIIKKETPSFTLYEDDDLIVILDAFPDADGHTLIIPKKHCTDIYELDDELLLKVFTKAKETPNKITDKISLIAMTLNIVLVNSPWALYSLTIIKTLAGAADVAIAPNNILTLKS